MTVKDWKDCLWPLNIEFVTIFKSWGIWNEQRTEKVFKNCTFDSHFEISHEKIMRTFLKSKITLSICLGFKTLLSAVGTDGPLTQIEIPSALRMKCHPQTLWIYRI